MTSQREAELEKKIKELEAAIARATLEAKGKEQNSTTLDESKVSDKSEVSETERLAKFNDSTFDPGRIDFENDEVTISYGKFEWEAQDSHQLNDKILANYSRDNLLKIVPIINKFIAKYDRNMKDMILFYNSELEDNAHFKAAIENIIHNRGGFLSKEKTSPKADKVEHKKIEITDEKKLTNINKEQLIEVINDTIFRLYNLNTRLSKMDEMHDEPRDENNNFRRHLYTEKDYNELSQLHGE